MTTSTCQTCADITKTSRYCAPARCYCGHNTCPAYATWIDPWTQPFNETTTKPSNRKRSSWDDRKEATWIDQL